MYNNDFILVFVFEKDEKIIDMASKGEWGNFATSLHQLFCTAPGIIADCEMFQFKEEGYSRGGRCTVSMKMPNTDWVINQPAEGAFKSFPYKSNGKKIIMPLYLKLIESRVKAKANFDKVTSTSLCDHFVMVFNNKSVQVLLYGYNCTFPFAVTAY